MAAVLFDRCVLMIVVCQNVGDIIMSASKSLTVTEEIAQERGRHVTEKGFSFANDDKYTNHELTRAAVCYIAGQFMAGQFMQLWPFNKKWWKPTDRRRDLIKAASLIVAEIERIDRAEERRNDAMD